MKLFRRRIDDRIRAACLRAVKASDGNEISALQELLSLVKQKSERLKNRAAKILLNQGHPDVERRRRFQ